MRGRQFDEDEWHNIGSSVLHLLEKAEVPAQASRDMLLRLYESDPCSISLNSVVETLRKAGLVPDWVAQECVFDAEPSVAELFKHSNNSPPFIG